MNKSRYFLLVSVAVLLLFCSFAHVDAASYSVTHYLHKSGVGTVNTINTQGYTLNTTTDWSGSTQTRSGEVAAASAVSWQFYIYPTLKGTLTHAGVPTVTLYLKTNSSVSDVDYITTINKISAAGSRTQLSTKTTANISLSTSYAAKTNTHASLSTTVATDFMLELNVTLSGSASNLNYTIAFDTATYQSKMVLVATDPLSVTVTSDKTIYEWHEQATVTVTVTDVWGGYDISGSTHTLSWSDPTGLTGTATQSSYGDAQYTNTYTYTFTPKNSGGAGVWTCTSSTTDQSSNSYSSSSYSFTLKTEGGSVPPDASQPVQSTDPTVIYIVVGVLVVVALIYWVQKK